LGVIGVLLTTSFFVIQYSYPRKTIEKQPDELIAILEHRANRIRNELTPYYQYAEVSKFLKQFDELHAKHIAALRANNLILAHEQLVEIHKLSADLEFSEFGKRHSVGDATYDVDLRKFMRGPMICLYVNGSADDTRTPLGDKFDAQANLDETVRLYDQILNSEGIINNLRWWKR